MLAASVSLTLFSQRNQPAKLRYFPYCAERLLRKKGEGSKLERQKFYAKVTVRVVVSF